MRTRCAASATPGGTLLSDNRALICTFARAVEPTFREHVFFSGVNWGALLEQAPPEVLPESESEKHIEGEEWHFTEE